jgi:hypothetical protein
VCPQIFCVIFISKGYAMQKRIVLLIIFMVLNLNIYSQVVIKDEIEILDFEGVSNNPIMLSMPFYGRAEVFIRRPWAGDCQWPAGYVCFHVNAGANSVTNGCCNCQPNSNCFNQQSEELNFNNLPQATPIEIYAQQCKQPEGVWIDVPIYYVLISETEYKLWGNLNGQPACEFGYVKFYSSTPPGCNNATPCSGPPELPTVILDIQQNLFENVDVCSDINNAAGFQPVGIQQLGALQPDPCFNKQTQRWQYEFANGHTVHFNVVIDVCESNINYFGFNLIDDYEDFPVNYGCQNVMHDMIGHLFYPPEVNLGGYFVRSILNRHELEHKWYFQNILLGLQNEFQNDMYMAPKNCADLPTVLDAYNYFNSIKVQNLLKWWKKAVEIKDNETELYKTNNEEEKWLRDKIFWAHERATQLKISKFIFQKINTARNYYCL